jgi:hypothetical protein
MTNDNDLGEVHAQTQVLEFLSEVGTENYEKFQIQTLLYPLKPLENGGNCLRTTGNRHEAPVQAPT